MSEVFKRNAPPVLALLALAAVVLAAIVLFSPVSQPLAADATAKNVVCCKPGDQTPPTELVKQVPVGDLHSPYPDYKKLAKDDPKLINQFLLPGCDGCHGGDGGGGMCPALGEGVWMWGNTDDVLFRLITLGSQGLKKEGFHRIQWGTVKGWMPPMGSTIKTSDQLWKIIAWIRSINPPDSNPPKNLVAPHMKATNYDD